MTHIVCGYPDLEKSKDILFALAYKSQFIEVQIPFSDPIADWPTIEKANHDALDAWMTPDKCFQFLKEVIGSGAEMHCNASLQGKVPPVLIMTYFNIVNFYGAEEFCKKAKEAWVYGLIIPDFPFDEEEFDNLMKFSKKYNLHLIQVVSPSTSDERLKKIWKISSGFVYAMSQNMTTWNEIDLRKDLKNYISNLKKYISLPIWVWFWISKKEEVDFVNEIADFAIIWSSVIRKYQEGKTHEEWVEKIEEFVDNLV